MNYKPGDIVSKRNSKDNECYIYLGKVIEDEMCSLIRTLGVECQDDLGWFVAYPIKPVNGWYESHVPIYAWFLSLFEKVETPSCAA